MEARFCHECGERVTLPPFCARCGANVDVGAVQPYESTRPASAVQRYGSFGASRDLDAAATLYGGSAGGPYPGSGSYGTPPGPAGPPFAATPWQNQPLGPPPSTVLTIVITFFFGLWGLIPASSAASQARATGHPTKPVWRAFWITFLVPIAVTILAYLLFFGSLLAMMGLSSADTPAGVSTSVRQATTGATAVRTTTAAATRTVTNTATATTTQMSDTEARRLLNSEVASYAVRTDDHYLVELSAKWVGAYDPSQTAANGTSTFYAPDILAEYRGLKARFGPNVHLVLASTFGKQAVNPKIPAGEPLYVTIYDPGSFSGQPAATAWCAASFPGFSGAALDNVCLPRPASPAH